MSRPKILPLLSLLFVILLIPATLVAQASTTTIKIPDGTPVKLSLLDALSSASANVDDPVHLEVMDDVKLGGTVVIPKGSTASGHVVEVEPKKRMGCGGKLNFSVDHVKAPDGTNVRLRASSTRKGEDKTGTVIVGSVLLSPLFLIMRGKDINIPRGTQFNAYVDGDREIAFGGPTLTPAAPQPAAQPASSPAPAATEEPSTALLKSTPDGAEITVDGKYVGSTPSTVRLAPGEHVIIIEKSGFKPWQRAISVSPGGTITINASLEGAQ